LNKTDTGSELDINGLLEKSMDVLCAVVFSVSSKGNSCQPVMLDLSRPCDACGREPMSGGKCCPKCNIHFCFTANYVRVWASTFTFAF
jgi:hypothetical protein